MGWLAAHDGHVVKGRKRPSSVLNLHGFLHLFGYLLHDGVGHGGHEVLERVHDDVCLSLEWVLPDLTGFSRELSVILHLREH